MHQEIDLSNINLNLEPPTEEPARQYFFMAKCRAWVKEYEKNHNYLPSACVVNMGCQMNARDSEKLLGVLRAVGYQITDSEEADFVIYNTCTVRENANLKVYGRLGFLKTRKKKNPNMKIALCGCMMQEPAVVEKIKASYRFVDIIFGTHNIYKLAELIYENIVSKQMIVDIWESTDRIVEELPNKLTDANRELLEESIQLCYKRINRNKEEIDEMADWIQQIRLELKRKLVRKQEKEDVNNGLYAYMHDIFGAEIIEIFDKEYNARAEKADKDKKKGRK